MNAITLPERLTPADLQPDSFAPWPEWVTAFREHQIDATHEIVEAFNSGADVVMVDAPTGSGKTILAEAVRRALRAPSTMFVCNTIGLQEQFIRDFDYARLIKGANNYQPLKVRAGVTCADCAGETCVWCDNGTDAPRDERCPYRIDLRRAKEAALTVANTAYFLRAANFANQFTGRDLVIADESDTLESILVDLIEFAVPHRWLTRLKIDDTVPPKGSHIPTAQKWARDMLLPALFKFDFDTVSDDPVEVRRAQKQAGELVRIAKDFAESNPELWIRDNKAGPAVWKPIVCHPWAEKMLWRHGKKWLLMTGSMVSAAEQIETLGAENLNVATVRVPMTFPKENRPIIIAGVANMSKKTRDAEMPKMAEAIRRILTEEAAPSERVLVHTVSYEIAAELLVHLKLGGVERRLFTYHDSKSRDTAFRDYAATDGAVLLAPSMDRGFDFKGDLARHVIIAKVPFPNLGDARTSARLRHTGGQSWYTVQAVRSVLQMTGRGVRSATDTCTTWILDSQFQDQLYGKNRRLFPTWWSDAIRRGYPIRKLMS